MQRAGRDAHAGQGHVDGLAGQARVDGGALQVVLAGIDGLLQGRLGLVHLPAHLLALLRRHAAQGLQDGREPPLLAQLGHAQVVEGPQIRGRLDGRQGLGLY